MFPSRSLLYTASCDDSTMAARCRRVRSARPSMRRSVRASASDDSAATITATPVASHTTTTAMEVVLVDRARAAATLAWWYSIRLPIVASRELTIGCSSASSTGISASGTAPERRSSMSRPVVKRRASSRWWNRSRSSRTTGDRAAARRVDSSARDASSASRSSCRYLFSPVKRNARVLRDTRSRRLRSLSVSPRSSAARASASSDVRTTLRMTTAAAVTAPIATRASRNRAIGARSHAMVWPSVYHRVSPEFQQLRVTRHGGPSRGSLRGCGRTTTCSSARVVRADRARNVFGGRRDAGLQFGPSRAERVGHNAGEEQVRKERSNEDSTA